MFSNEINDSSSLILVYRPNSFADSDRPSIPKGSTATTSVSLPPVESVIDKFQLTGDAVSMLEASEENLLYNRQGFLKKR